MTSLGFSVRVSGHPDSLATHSADEGRTFPPGLSVNYWLTDTMLPPPLCAKFDVFMLPI